MKEPKIKAGSVSHLRKQRDKIFPNVYRLKAVFYKVMPTTKNANNYNRILVVYVWYMLRQI